MSPFVLAVIVAAVVLVLAFVGELGYGVAAAIAVAAIVVAIVLDRRRL